MNRAAIKQALGFDQIKSAGGWNAVCADSSDYEYRRGFGQEVIPLLGWGVSKYKTGIPGSIGEATELDMAGIIAVGNRVYCCKDVFWFLGYVHDKNAEDRYSRFVPEARRFEQRLERMLHEGEIYGYTPESDGPQYKTFWRDERGRVLDINEVFEIERDRASFGNP